MSEFKSCYCDAPEIQEYCPEHHCKHGCLKGDCWTCLENEVYAERDSSRRFAKAWKRLAKAQMFIYRWADNTLAERDALRAKVEWLREENERLRSVVDAARDVSKCLHNGGNVPWDCDVAFILAGALTDLDRAREDK